MTRVLVNETRGDHPGGVPDRAPLEFHSRLPGYRASPLIEAGGLARELGVASVHVKDESSRLGLPSFKILGASWGVYRALERRFGTFDEWRTLDELEEQLAAYEPVTLAAATDGNHGRAVARMARLLGLGARIFVPRGTARARIEAIEGEGARCDVVDGTYDDAVTRSAEEASESCLLISDTSWPGYEDVPRWVIEGYSTIFWEIEDELSRRAEKGFDVVVIQLGVGALGAAAVRHFRSAGARAAALVGIEPESAACVLASMEAGGIVTVSGPHDSIMAGLNCGTPSLVAWPIVASGFDAVVAIDDEPARAAMRALARAGIEAGETGAAGVAGLAQLVHEVEGREARARVGLDGSARVLVLCTEGATDPDAYARAVAEGG